MRIAARTSRYGSVPKGARYIVVLRDPMDVAVSFYSFFCGWFFPAPGSGVRVSDDPASAPIGIDDFVEHFFLRRGRPASDMENASIWDFMLSWLPRGAGARGEPPEEPEALIVFFEDMREDLVGVIRRVARYARTAAASAAPWRALFPPRARRFALTGASADAHLMRPPATSFIGVGEGDDALIQKVASMSTFEFMKAHEGQFDEHMTKEKRNPACGLLPSAGARNSKVMGGAGGRPRMADGTVEKLHARWRASVAAETGYETYADLRRAYGLNGTR